MACARRTVEIDTDALRDAQAALGTNTIDDTVNEALRAVGRRHALQRAAQYVREGKLQVPDEAELARLRRPG